MAIQRNPAFISPEQYLEIERTAEFRSEYISGEMFAMASPSKAHGLLVSAIDSEVGNVLRDGSCDISIGISVAAPASYLIPDVVVYCDGGDFTSDNEILRNPVVIFEVLSASTSDYDHGHKWIRYQMLPSLMHYVLVSQDEPRVDVYTRESDGGWHYDVLIGFDSVLHLSHINGEVPLADIYKRVFRR
jgi:Uma2 family endonuclease